MTRRPLLPASTRLETCIPRTPIVMRADRTEIDQVLMNVALNARDAMPEGGTLRIELGAPEALSGRAHDTAQDTARAVMRDTLRTPPQSTPPSGAVAARHVRETTLVVADTGVGMTDDVRARLVEPFFTTKQEGNGTGLGLATVYAIVRQAGGTVTVDSHPGAGSRFTVSLPVADAPCPCRASADDIASTARVA